MTNRMPKRFNSLNDAHDYILDQYDGDLRVAIPLGLGKPNQLINMIYDSFVSNPQKKLEIYTALSLDIPQPKTEIEAKLLEKFIERHFGGQYPRLNYLKDLLDRRPPENIKVYEFYFLAGQYSQVKPAQQNYISLNYTHVARGIAGRGLQMAIQYISPARKNTAGQRMYSLSCNPDVTLDLVDHYQKENKRIFTIGVVHPDLPYLGGDAEVSEDFFDVIIESPEVQHPLFALPRNSVDDVDHMIGFHASQLLPDGGTLQIGIGSLSDALVYSLILRHEKNAEYKTLVESFWNFKQRPLGLEYCEEPFESGIYGTSEMLMDGFMYLRQANILKREIFDHDEHKKTYLHGAFFLGSRALYDWLKNLNEADYSGLSMTRVSKVNDLYDSNEHALRRQRRKARFYNTTMNVNLLGGVSSDTLPNGTVISGVGGQYNFVSMAQELHDAHSVLLVRSTRTSKGKRISNITILGEQMTIPRHLRDIVITEYGIANLKGKTDAEVVAALIEIADSEFQPELIRWAKEQGKLPQSYELPKSAQNNTPQKIQEFLGRSQEKGLFSNYPFGSDFTEVEQKLIASLSALKEKSKLEVALLLLRGVFTSASPFREELQHLHLDSPRTLKQWIGRFLVLGSLQKS
ncbi:acetyl-CoA hydrolase/transferase C-terminal domain-containing protein [Pseudobdellovibrio exovorus]|uniref:Acetyl-CoA hydrolase/transferase C-terminal domain-containing protein n=1 Tax=Pseudobdellovibrio exovorus JSS TaxID=1184267 RepID=M4V5H2_9BACT|nr:acetyl-CoA hydrolase/transferase C-terminal domain-containing protein [Pseudobdellovibrio exovorus]AGH94587.1 hypothetical protein A11Q_367 [Pseudobdellovibrio exovorus JSS]